MKATSPQHPGVQGGGAKPRGLAPHRIGILSRLTSTNLTPYLFILPAFAIYAVFTLFPLGRLFIFSLQDWDGISKNPQWTGLDNYVTVFQDKYFWMSLGHNLWWVVLASIPIVLGLALAIILHFAKPRGRNVYRTLVFLPYTLAVVVSGFMWMWIYHPATGALNAFLKLIGLGSLARGWLGHPDTALTALAMAGAWSGYGFCMVLFLAGLGSIDKALYDAASVDGANAWQRFRYVTLPGLANTMNVVVLIVFMNTMRVFDFVYVTTKGGPVDSTQVLATIIYRETFQFFHVGFGSAFAVVTLAIILVASLVYLYVRERRA
jgi:raffinose/stachyose/melibiose transport system permease protein